jgi:hypothetical protein
MKVWELNSPRDTERLILEQDLIIQELRENNRKLSDASMHWMVKFAEAQAKIRSLENEIVAVLDMYGK